MTKKVFKNIRHTFGKTQRELGSLLGLSTKAIQSFEQGWRTIPGHVERQILFLLALKRINIADSGAPCWDIRHCSDEIKKKCPAFEMNNGYLCWMINGTWCQGKKQKSWKRKMSICKKCETFKSVVHIPES